MTGSPFKMSPSELGMFCFLLIHDSQQEHKDIWEMRYSSWKIDVLPSSLQEALCWMLRPHCELLHPGNSKFLSAPSCTQLHLNRLSVQMNSSSILHKQDFILGCLHLPHLGDLLYRDQAVLSQPSLLLLGGGFNNEQRGEYFSPPWLHLGNLLHHQFWSLKSTQQATCCTAEVASSSSSTGKSKAFVCQGGANCCSENDCCEQGKCKLSLTFTSLFWKIEKTMIFCQASVVLVAVKTLLIAKRRRHVDLNIFAAARAWYSMSSWVQESNWHKDWLLWAFLHVDVIIKIHSSTPTFSVLMWTVSLAKYKLENTSRDSHLDLTALSHSSLVQRVAMERLILRWKTTLFWGDTENILVCFIHIRNPGSGLGAKEC